MKKQIFELDITTTHNHERTASDYHKLALSYDINMYHIEAPSYFKITVTSTKNSLKRL